MTVEVVTFGCRLNLYESEAIKKRASEAQLRDAVVVNTCAVTAEAVRQSRQAIRRLKQERPGRRIIVTGCAAQTEPQTYAGMAEVDAVLGNTEKLTASAYTGFGLGFGLEAAEKIRVNDIMSVRETAAQMVDHFDGHTRAFLQVQNGCDHRCTFCVIPFGRGNSRSVPMGGVVSEARRLVEAGFPEIVLTGVDLTSYGADLPAAPSLGLLVEKILKQVPELKRLRLSSIDSIEADPVLMRLIAQEERLMPHFHLSAQSGDDLILKRMKRRHTRADTINFCETVRRHRPDAAFGADLIAGFPTETETMFENSLSLVDDAGLSRLHVFPYSPRPGTAAARMPQLPRALVKERAARLRARGEAALGARLDSMVGARRIVLMERGGVGRTPCFTPVAFNGQPGAFLPLTLTARGGDRLMGALS
ncbi:MAG TPA: tRNA (N(6)-L-threonylcarbamoyladenosine(37)-C(2))-methylthiotransferase MtaB [Rhizomicrobium sp.]|jgi:threonylcarbamoyladenosine tRNA methylthiotransferase MtaB|nr:tRNA (N(6)-L-threonylcarbamoyladenosine(37)-C(2))-methylthiotransferase MtaB [Rhizomicrobium sp.]